MIGRWLFIAALVLPTQGAGAPVTVQSGEHPGFSRLSLLFPALPDWRVGRVEGGYEFRSDMADAVFDTAEVYDRIGRQRVAALEPRPGGRLFIKVTCACRASAFTFRDTVVIDIRDGAPGPGAAFEDPLPPPGPDAAIAPADALAPAEAASAPGFELALLGPLKPGPLRTTHAWRDALALELPAVATVPSGREQETAPMAETLASSPLLEHLQTDLAGEIARAISQGLVEPVEPGVAPPASPDPAPAPAAVPAVPHSGEDQDTDNIRIETAFDRGQELSRERTPLTLDGQECLENARLDVARWGTPPSEGGTLGARRGRIVGEFDAVDPAGIADLARNYIYLTFGLEARVLIGAFDAEVPDADLILTLADIVDDGVAHDPGPLAGQLACDNRASFWALLAAPGLRPGDRVATKSVLTAFSELPLHLRRHLGPFAAERFLAIGDADSASALRNAIRRAPGDHGAELDMMEAGIALQSGNDVAGVAYLERVVSDDGPMAAEALILLIEAEIAAGRAVPKRLQDNAAALAFTHRGTPVGADLSRVRIRALAHQGDYVGALDSLAANEDLTDATRVELRQEIHALAAARAPTETFLLLVLPGPVPLGTGAAADEVRRSVAARLIGLGLTEPARRLLSDDPGLPTEEDRLLYARAFLAERRADLVLGYLAGLDGEPARLMQAEAHALAGQYDAAADAYAAIGDDARHAGAAWRGADWEEAAALTDGPRQQAAALAAGAAGGPRVGGEMTEDALVEPGPIATTRALLEESRAARRILEDLLAAAGVPES